MSKLDTTTQDLFLRLGPTSRSRSARADALFRRLRMETSDQIADALMRAPRAIDASCFSESEETPRQRKNAPLRPVKPAP